MPRWVILSEVLLDDDGVAATRRLLESFAIEKAYAAADRLNESFVLELICGLCDCGAARSE